MLMPARAQTAVNRRVNFEACNSNMSSLFKFILGTTAPLYTVWTLTLKGLPAAYKMKGEEHVRENKARSLKFPWNENITC